MKKTVSVPYLTDAAELDTHRRHGHNQAGMTAPEPPQNLECPLCTGHDFEALPPVAAAGGKSSLCPDGHKYWFRCTGCGLQAAHPLPPQDTVAAFLEEKIEARIAEDQNEFSRTIFKFFTEELPISNRRLREIEARVGTGKLLDIGAGWGVFMGVARERGWNAQAVDLCLYATQLTKQIFQLDIHAGAFEDMDFPDAPFDAITMWEYLEHALSPVQAVRKAAGLIRPGGLLALSTPNTESLFNKSVFNRGDGQWDTPDHFHLFSRDNIEKLLRDCGLKPQYFNSGEPFYWSMDLMAVKE